MIKSFLVERREHLLLIALLMSLHGAIWTGLGTPLSRALMLAHLGLFLIWQPIKQSSLTLSWYNAAAFIVLAISFSYWVNWWLAISWLILLIGIIGGRVVINQPERYTYFLVLIVLFFELFIGCIPHLIVTDYKHPVFPFIQHILPIVPLFLLLFPKIDVREALISVDPLHAITASLLTGLLALGTLVIISRVNLDYFSALFQTLLIIGSGMLLISWLLSTNSGTGGVSQIWTRSLLNIGTPFEQWLHDLSLLRDEHHSANEFLNTAILKLASLPWVSGVMWNLDNELNIHGIKTSHKINLSISGIPLTMYTQVKISGALLLHCKLLIQLIEYLYESKLNEEELAKQAHLQAIYETGARITHDIKNLLQSMHSMVTILQADNTESNSKSLTILKKQFPYFIQRLEQAVYKLQSPEKYPGSGNIHLQDWWREFTSHHRDQKIRFDESLQDNPLVSFDLFDNVAENLLENAMNKRKEQPDIDITVSLFTRENTVRLSVMDTGKHIHESITTSLFKQPVPSDNGFGIGLLQANKLSNSLGYKLELACNEDGNVCFELGSINVELWQDTGA